MRGSLLAALAVLVALPAAARAQVPADTRAAIEKTNERFVEAYNAGDGAAVAAMYTPDAFLLPPGAEPVGGADEIRQFWTGAAEGNQAKLTTRELYGTGDMVTEVGSYVITAADGAHLDHGKYIVLWKKDGGQWKLFRDMWNSSMSN